MRATREYVASRFDYFNRLCFGGELANLPIQICCARSFMGQVRYSRKSGLFGNRHYSDFVLRISNKFDLQQDVLDDIIIHEMIHYYILSRQLQDNSPHGNLFRRKMNEINRLHHRHVSVRHHGTSQENDSDTEKRHHIVCLSRFDDGRRLVTVMSANPSVYLKIWDEILSYHRTIETICFLSTDSYFNRVPHSRTPKFYALPPDELRPHLTSVNILTRRDNKILLSPATDISDFL